LEGGCNPGPLPPILGAPVFPHPSEPEGPLARLEELPTCPYPELNLFIPHPPNRFLGRSILILSSKYIPTAMWPLFFRVLHQNRVCTSSVRATSTCPLTVLDLTVRIYSGSFSDGCPLVGSLTLCCSLHFAGLE